MSTVELSTKKAIPASAPAQGRPSLSDLFLRHRTLVQYFVIGATASVIDVVLFVVLHNLLDQTTFVSQFISVSSAIAFSFIVNARHNFKTTDRVVYRMFCFVAVCMAGMLLGYGIIEAGVMASINANIGKLLSLPAVFIFQYILNSRITFRKTAA